MTLAPWPNLLTDDSNKRKTMRRRKLFSVAVAGILVGGGLAACGDESPNADARKKTGATVLRIGVPKGPQQNNQNPFVYGSAAFELGYRWAIYEPLQIWNPVRPDEAPKPWLATNVEWAPDLKAATITVRDNATWSDGKPLTAEDVAFTYDMVKKSPALNGYGTKYGDITASGNTVTIAFGESQYTRQKQLFSQIPIVPKHIWESVKDPGQEPNTGAVGSGPYTLKTFAPASAVLAVRDSGYWQTAPAVKEIQVKTFTGNDSLTTALANGEVDWANVFIPNYEKVFVAKDPDHHAVWAPTQLGVHALHLNSAKAPLNDVAVRKAVNLVVDRKKIFERASGNYFHPPVTNVTGLPTPAADPFIAAKYVGKELAVDVEGAKKVLTDAGYKYSGDKLLTASGQPVKLTLTAPAAFNDYQTSLTLVAEDLQKIGIDATVDKPTYEAWDKDVAQGRFDAAMRWSNGGSTPFDIYQTFMDAPKPAGEQAFTNFGRFDDKAAVAALETYRSATTDADRQAALDRLQDLFVQTVPAVILGADTSGGAYSTKNWTGWPEESNPYASGQPDNASSPLVYTSLKPA